MLIDVRDEGSMPLHLVIDLEAVAPRRPPRRRPAPIRRRYTDSPFSFYTSDSKRWCFAIVRLDAFLESAVAHDDELRMSLAPRPSEIDAVIVRYCEGELSDLLPLELNVFSTRRYPDENGCHVRSVKVMDDYRRFILLVAYLHFGFPPAGFSPRKESHRAELLHAIVMSSADADPMP